ncbi:MAG: 4Fe-4S binding protein [Candidatus Edwardsbacteria bacterium]|nr:4Fe-4S binding protein [Candidatus Edwardsbacteria bacterium]
MIRKLFLPAFLAAAFFWVAASAEEIRTGEILVDTALTISGIAQANGIPEAKLLKGLKLEPGATLLKLSQAGRSTEQASSVIRKIKVVQATENAKDWRLILSKFALWIIGLKVATILLMKKGVTGRIRLIWMIGTALLYGFILGSDPNPMGTVKDAIVLYGTEGVVFPPRMAALGVFLLLVFVSNKSICGWGCHFGALQDAVSFSPVKKFKLPFWLTNGLRITVLAGIILAVFAWRLDWVGLIDPFKVFNLKMADIGLGGVLFISLMLILSLFFYRPWCQLFCPFGLAGWVVEQFSLLSPRIDRRECIKCLNCVRVCPTRAMEGIYDDRKIHADCFACGRCIGNCPVKAIKWDRSNKKQ